MKLRKYNSNSNDEDNYPRTHTIRHRVNNAIEEWDSDKEDKF